METLHQQYDVIMDMPIGRRKRFCMEKDHLERIREAHLKER